MKRLALLAAALPLLFAAGAPRRALDDFRDPAAWKPFPADGVRLDLSPSEGREGPRGAIRMDFDFGGHAGWAAIRKRYPLRLTENWAFELRLRGETTPQTLEFKLLDPSGRNVWWSVRRDYEFPREWTTVRVPRRQLSFAWGPAGGGEIREVGWIEIAVTASTGGRGSVWFDELAFEELPPSPSGPLAARASASSETPGSPAAAAADANPATFWRSGPDEEQQITLDLGARREVGGLVLDWDERDHPRRYDVLLSEDGRHWDDRREVRPARGGRAWLYLPDAEARFIRLRLTQSAGGRGYALAEASVRPPEFSSSPTEFLEAVARDSPRGVWPRSLEGQQLYWTVVGVDAGRDKGLISEDGALEIGRGGFSIEPFLWSDGRLLGWAEAVAAHSLDRGDLPVATVTRRHAAGFSLEITAFADGPAESSTLLARYRVRNERADAASARLLLAIRSLQVNPPTQFLNVPGGFSPIHDIGREAGAVTVDGRRIEARPSPSAFGAAPMDAGEIGGWLSRGQLPAGQRARDPDGFASGAAAWDLTLAPGDSAEVTLASPLSRTATPAVMEPDEPAGFDLRLERARRDWAEKLDRVSLRLPSSAGSVEAALRASIAWILVLRDGPAIQPGARAYARSWIRDGAMIAEALLRLGHEAEVRDYLRWYAPRLLPDGRVPCCVDRRGADPVPENDSAGELLHLAGEYHRFTSDADTVREVWPQLSRAAAFLDELRSERRTAEYRAAEKRTFYGLLPESISHEGYSAHPVHSYWDDFWAVLGLSDASRLAAALGHARESRRLAASRDELRRDLHDSIRRVISRRRLDYVPGSADLGDFDATSTTIALSPGEEGHRLPQRELRRTFERYWRAFQERRARPAGGEAYTPYEWRIVGSLVRLGWRDRARQLFDFLMADRRPPEWNQWAEVVGRDPRSPRFLGDMPHGWVASDFLRATLDLFAYERPEDDAVVLAAGLPPEWIIRPGAAFRGLRTRWGALDLAVVRDGDSVRLSLAATGDIPPGGFVLRPPLPAGTRRARVDGRRVAFAGTELTIRQRRAEVLFQP